MSAEKIQNLKVLLGGLEHHSLREFWPAPQLEDGIPKGMIVELSGNARTEWLLQFLQHHHNLRVFWCEKKQRILPLALQQRGLKLERVTFGVFPEGVAKPIRRIIQSQIFQIIIAPNDIKEVRIYQALQLLTEKSNCTLFLLARKKLSNAWPISLQLDITRNNERPTTMTDSFFNIHIIKQKHRSVK